MATEQQPDCGFDGNPDLYGLGLRLGFYIQAAPSTLAIMVLYRETIYIWSSSVAFVLATFAVLLRDTIRNTLKVSEIAIVAWLLSFQVARMVPLILGIERYGMNPINQTLLYLFSSLTLAGNCYFVWFWNVGLDSMPRTACEEYAFVFVRVDLRGGFRTFNKVWFNFFTAVQCLGLLSTCGPLAELRAMRPGMVGAADNPLSLLASLLLYVHYRLNPEKRQKAMQEALVAEAAMKNAPLELGKKTIGPRLFWFVALTTGLIPAIEMQIKWNGIRGVNRLDSPGQLIPLLLSLGQLVHVLYSIMRGQDSLEDHLAEKPASK